MVDADRDELRRYREEEERGLLLHLPVPLGAAVWRVRENPACHYGVRQAEIFLFGEVVTSRRAASSRKRRSPCACWMNGARACLPPKRKGDHT